MKKLKILSIIIIISMLLSSTLVLAANEFQVKLQPSAIELQRGETFNVKVLISGNSDEKGIQAIQAKFEYDTNVLELQKNSTYLDAYTENGTYEVVVTEESILINDYNLNNIQNNVVIATIPFRVKDDAKFGESVVSVSDIIGGHLELETSDMSTEYAGTSEDIKLNIVEQKNEEVVKLNEIRVTKNPNKISYNVGEKFDPEGMIITAYYSDNSSSIISNYTYSQRDELKESDNKITISYTEGNETKETTIDIEVSKKNGSETQNNNNGNDKNSQENKDENITENEKKQIIEKEDSKIDEQELEKSNEADGKIPQTGVIGYTIPGILIITLIAVAIIFKKKYNKLNF